MEVSIIIICLILSAFFSGMEIAYISSNKLYLGIETRQDDLRSKVLAKLVKNPSKFIVSMLVGHSVAMVMYGFFMSDLILEYFVVSSTTTSLWKVMVIQILVVSITIIVTSEFFPKVFFQIYANTFIKVFAIPAYIFHQLFYYISSAIIWMSDSILAKVFQIKSDDQQLLFSKVELGNYITEQMKAIENHGDVDSEIQIFQNALEFSGVKARDIMNPRTEISAVEIHDSVEELKQLFIETGYSKILVYQNSLDDIIGYVHSFELFKKPKSIKSVMIAVEFVPETIFIKDVMNILTKKRKSVAVVLDEYGGTSGMVTIEDIVEELFGEIEDEHDSDEELIDQKLEKGCYLFSTRWQVQDINEKYKTNIPESESYTTLGGFIVNHTKEIPQKGENIQIENFHFVVEEATNKKIELVKMTIKD